jgi:hypothetical protein
MSESRSWVIAVGLLSVATASAQATGTQYSCDVKHSAGLHFDRAADTWVPQPSTFGRKYILRHFSEDEKNDLGYQLLLRFEPKAHWAFSRLGDQAPLAACFESEGRFSCKAIVQSLEFDSGSGRFETVSRGAFIVQGYWQQLRREDPERIDWMAAHGRANDPSNPDDLFLEIGECSPS